LAIGLPVHLAIGLASQLPNTVYNLPRVIRRNFVTAGRSALLLSTSAWRRVLSHNKLPKTEQRTAGLMPSDRISLEVDCPSRSVLP